LSPLAKIRFLEVSMLDSRISGRMFQFEGKCNPL
jgi:hypothetical protein